MKLDGLGNPLKPEDTYYVQDARDSVGNCASWWRINRAGYCCDIADAGMYTGKECDSMRETDIPWPRLFVQENIVKHVRVETLERARPAKVKCERCWNFIVPGDQHDECNPPSCNRHDDCRSAKPYDCCHSDDCEDCFGK